MLKITNNEKFILLKKGSYSTSFIINYFSIFEFR